MITSIWCKDYLPCGAFLNKTLTSMYLFIKVSLFCYVFPNSQVPAFKFNTGASATGLSIHNFHFRNSK